MVEDHTQLDPHAGQVGERLAAAQSLDEVVAALGEAARQAIGCDGIAVALRDDDCCHYVAENAVRPLWMGRRLPLEACVSGWAMLNDATAIVPDIALDPRVPLAPYQDKSIHSLVMAPIGAPEPVAALGAYWCALVFLEAQTVARVEALARLATEALLRISTGPIADLRSAAKLHGQAAAPFHAR